MTTIFFPPCTEKWMRDINKITGEIVDASYRLHTRLGPGLVESVYEAVLARWLEERGFAVERQKAISFETRRDALRAGVPRGSARRRAVVVELKSVEKLAPVHAKQVLTYLRLLNLPIGLLINFGVARLNDGGVHRIVNSRTSAARAILDV
jgi:GxxExxY protein